MAGRASPGDEGPSCNPTGPEHGDADGREESDRGDLREQARPVVIEPLARHQAGPQADEDRHRQADGPPRRRRAAKGAAVHADESRLDHQRAPPPDMAPDVPPGDPAAPPPSAELRPPPLPPPTRVPRRPASTPANPA